MSSHLHQITLSQIEVLDCQYEFAECPPHLSLSGNFYILHSTGLHNFLRNLHLKILCASRVATISTLRIVVQNWVTMVTWHLRFVHPWFSIILMQLATLTWNLGNDPVGCDTVDFASWAPTCQTLNPSWL
jgi:hypothetical protein